MRSDINGSAHRLSATSSSDGSSLRSPRSAVFGGNMGRTSSPNSTSTSLPPPTLSLPTVKTSTLGLRDELDDKAYMYALRVGYINNLLYRAFSKPSSSSKSRQLSSPSLASSPGTSMTQSSSSYFLQASPAVSSATTPSSGSPLPSPMPDKEVKSSRASFWGGRKKNESDPVKLPKDFLVHFWEVLTSEGGDVVWRTAVNTLISHLASKKATKTPSGLNLREVPNLLEAFSTTLPVSNGTAKSLHQNSNSDANHHHQAHLLSLLLQSLQTWFSPLGKNSSEKDRDLHFRLRAEIEGYCLPEDERESTSTSTPAASSSRRRGSSIVSGKSSPPSSPSSFNVGIPPVPPLPGSASGRRNTREMLHMDLVEVVGRVFGVGKNKLERDLDQLKRGGIDERVYLSDLKLHLSALTKSDPARLSRTTQDRVEALQTEIANLLQACPDVGNPTMAFAPDTRVDGPYFTPTPDKAAVYDRLVERVYLLLGAESPPVTGERGEAELMNVCAGIWGIECKRIRELAVTFSFWKSAVRANGAANGDVKSTVRTRMMGEYASESVTESDRDALSWTERVREILEDLAADAETGLTEEEESVLRRVLADMHNCLINLILSAVRTIYPTRNYPPQAPSPSCISLVNAMYASPALIARVPKSLATESWLNVADEVRAGAVGDYVRKTQEFLSDENIDREGMLRGFEQTADWIENGLKRVAVAWHKNALQGRMDPPAVILSKQLPLFLAEMQVLEQPRAGSKAEDIFSLYERTSRLTKIWEELCPDQEIGFDVATFFEPHVREWLRGTEEVDTHTWVSRAVGMDSWVPEGSFRHSQSVIDLFEFIRHSVKTILTDLPLGEYNRACYLIDFAKTAATAISQYATTVQALFIAEISATTGGERAAEQPAAVAGKAGAWLAKGKQAVKSLERKKIEGFLMPPTACVKLTDIHAAKASTEDLMHAIGVDDTARVVREHKLRVGGVGKEPDRPARYLFSVSISRGENLLSKNLSKPADAFITVQDVSAGTRVHKTGTVIGRMDPAWEESCEVSISTAKMFEITCWDRLLVGKHDLIGKSTFKLDPHAFKDHPSRDIVLPLNPRGVVHLRLEMEGGEKHEAKFHLNRAIRNLDRAADDMTRKSIDKMSEFIRFHLSLASIQAVLRPLSAKARKGTVKATTVTEQEIESSLLPLFDYFDQVFSTFSVTLPDELKINLMLQIWRRSLDTLISLLIPPLSDKEATGEVLGAQEIHVVFQWLKLLKNFFNASENGQEHGVPISALQGGLYKELVLIGQYLDLPTPALKEKCVAAIKGAGRKGAKPAASSLANGHAANLSLSYSPAEEDERTAEILLRILRMRTQTSDFLGHSIMQLNQARMQRQGGL